MTKPIRLLFLLSLLTVLAVACLPGGSQVEPTLESATAGIEPATPTTEPATATAKPATTEAAATPTPDLSPDLSPTTAGPISGTPEEFAGDLKLAIAARDFDGLQAVMSDPFTVGYWLSEGVEYAPDEAADFLAASLLPEGAQIEWAAADVDLASMLDGLAPPSFLGPDKKVAATLLGRGWGEDGTGEAIQFITEQPDGSYRWEMMLFSGFGFMGWPTDVEAVLINADEATFYSGPGESYEPVATVFGGQTYPVIGISTDEQWYRLLCYDDGNVWMAQCWVSADPAVASPTAAP